MYVEVDEIYNLACPASPIHYQHDPVQTTKTSVHGAINMLGLAKRLNARILQTSTSEIYGDPSIHPQIESYTIVRKTASKDYNYIIDYTKNDILRTDISFNDANYPLGLTNTVPRIYSYDLSANYL